MSNCSFDSNLLLQKQNAEPKLLLSNSQQTARTLQGSIVSARVEDDTSAISCPSRDETNTISIGYFAFSKLQKMENVHSSNEVTKSERLAHSLLSSAAHSVLLLCKYPFLSIVRAHLCIQIQFLATSAIHAFERGDVVALDRLRLALIRAYHAFFALGPSLHLPHSHAAQKSHSGSCGADVLAVESVEENGDAQY